MANTSSGNDGVIKNSALTFVPTNTPAQKENPPNSEMQEQNAQAADLSNPERLVPPGLKALYDVCSALYPDQPNPLQVTTRLKYWLGGHDPLDYISMYWNPGVPEEHVPPHWHYISFGLSDLHGDGRVHWRGSAGPTGATIGASGPAGATIGPSGWGLELTLRLATETGPPPLWPPALLQALAGYVFATGNKFLPGDHISWHAPLDGQQSKLRHLLVAEDPKLPTVTTAHGTVQFLQLIGCTSKELKAAQRTSGFEVLQLIAEDTECGGPWLVTRIGRGSSAKKIKLGLASKPADLAGVSTSFNWTHWRRAAEEISSDSESLSSAVERQIKETLQRGLTNMSTDRSTQEGHIMSTDSFEMSSMERALPNIPELVQDSWRDDMSRVDYLDAVHIIFNAEGAGLLPLAIDGRVRHGRHFTWRCGAAAVTLLARGVSGALTTRAHIASHGRWLQILIPDELAKDMSQKLRCLNRLAESDTESDDEGLSEREDPPKLPLTLSWPKYGIKISVVPDSELVL